MKVSFVTLPTTIEPLGVMYLAAALKNAGHTVTHGFDGDVLAASIMPGSSDELLALLKANKRDGQRVIVGGPAPTYNPERYHLPWIEGVCRGDGEQAIVDFVEEKWEGTIRGEMCMMPPRPDRSIIYDQYPEHRDNPIRHFMLTRGCPYSCAYCFNHAYRKLYDGRFVLRIQDPQDAVDEIADTLREWGGKFVYFQDDTFNLKQSFLDAFLPLYREQVGLPFHCHVRAELVTEGQMEALRAAGCFSVRFAIETAGDKKQTLLNRGKITDADCIRAAEIINRSGIKLMTQNILCLPETTMQDDLETLHLNQRCKPTFAWASIYQPYRGTELGDYCYEKGLVEGEPGLFFSGSPLKIPQKEERERLQKCFSLYVSEPDPEAWIYFHYRQHQEQLIYGMTHQSGRG